MNVIDPNVRMTEVEYDPFATTVVRSFPTTDAQREIWLAAELGTEASLAYNESISLVMRGALNVPALQSALTALVSRHEALRATFDSEGATMLIASDMHIGIDFVDLATADQITRDARLAQLRASAVQIPFDLANGPLLRTVLVRTAPDTHELVLTAHHIVVDGWSFGIISRDLMTLYKQIALAQPVDLGAPDSYGDYALSMHDADQARATEADEHYWIGIFDRGQPVLDLPTDRPRGRQRSFASRRIDHVLPPKLVDAARQLGAKNGVSLFATLFSVFAAMLERLGGEGEVVLGVPAAGQSTRGLDALVGHCVNVLPVRVTADRKEPVTTLLKHAGGRILDAYDHQNCTFGQLLTKLNVQREANRLPLVSVLFNIDAAISPEMLSVDELDVALRSNPRVAENFEMFVNASQTKDGIILETQYQSELFDAETVTRWLQLYHCAIERAAADPQRTVGELFYAAPDDVRRLAAFNPAPQNYPNKERIETLFTRQCARTPDAIAAVCGERSITYRELDERSNAIARALVARGIGAGHNVGMACGRNVYLQAALLGILKSGAAYVPLDPSFPDDRLAYMCDDAGIKCIVSDSGTRSVGAADADTILADALTPDAKPVSAASETMAPAYVIYTSGSTGKPKGVVVHHQAVVNFLTSMASEPGLTAADRLVAVTTTSFDIAVLELYLPLTVGAQTIIADRETVLDGVALRKVIERHNATVLQATPAGWRLLIDAGWTGGNAFKALVGGEALPEDLAGELVARAGAVWNMYGPTETTVWSTCWHVPRMRDGIRIGRPIANTEVLILDDTMKLCPIGVPGEMFIGGDGVATGYWQRPELTDERFVIFDGARLYRTGDRGRWRNDGTLEHLGRLDFQVKVRGYRIELGEIEANLAKHDAIERAVVIVREDQPGDVRLVAYVVARTGESFEAKAVRAFLRKNLPDYAIPSHITVLPSIPVLPNGKIDRRALPRPSSNKPSFIAHAAPASATEVAVLEIMEAVLSVRGLGLDDDFFASGGHSILAARLIARLNKTFDLRLPLSTVFVHSSARALATVLDASIASNDQASSRITHQKDQLAGPLTINQDRMRFMEELHPGRVVYNTPSAHRLTGPFNKNAFNAAFSEMIRRQPTLRTFIDNGPDGPLQRVAEVTLGELPYEDLSAIGSERREAMLMQRMQAIIDQPIDIHAGPLFRAALYRLSDDEHVFFFMTHHIIWDGWSFDLLYEEMSALYPAALAGASADLPPPPFSYIDFAAWQRDWLKSDECAAQIAFWRQRYANAAYKPLTKSNSRRLESNGGVEWIRTGKDLTQRLAQIASQHRVTLNMIVLGVYGAMLSEMTSQSDVSIGVPVRGRQIGEVETLMGFFTNLVPVQIDCRTPDRFVDWLPKIKSSFAGALSNQDVPFAQWASGISTGRQTAGSAIYQSIFSFQDARERKRNWGELHHSSILVMQRGVEEDLGLWLMETAAGLEGGINYNLNLFDTESVRIFHDRFMGLLQRVADNPAQTIAALLSAPGTDTTAFNAWIAARSASASEPVVRIVSSNQGAAAGNHSELAAIWSRLLGIETVDIDPDDNFFDLGGTSLLVMKAVEHARQQLGVDVDPRRYVSETLRQIAQTPQSALATTAPPSASTENSGGISQIWARLLGMDAEDIQPEDNFFDLGGTSILAMQAVTAMERELSIRIDPHRMVSETIRQLASTPREHTAAAGPSALAVGGRG